MNNVNLIYDIKDITAESDYQQEPVSIDEMKDYLRLEGFVDEDEITTESLSNFDFDDILIADMIVAARKKMEKFLGVSLVFHTWKVLFTNLAGDIEFPYGPVQDLTSLAYKSGTAVGDSSIYTYGYDFLHLEAPLGEKMTAIYDAGYEECPEAVALAIKQCVSYWYENRITGEVPSIAKATASPYKRAWTWLT